MCPVSLLSQPLVFRQATLPGFYSTVRKVLQGSLSTRFHNQPPFRKIPSCDSCICPVRHPIRLKLNQIAKAHGSGLRVLLDDLDSRPHRLASLIDALPLLAGIYWLFTVVPAHQLPFPHRCKRRSRELQPQKYICCTVPRRTLED